MAGIFAELKRRNVIKVATLYGVGAWLVLQVADVGYALLGLSDNALRITASILALGLIPALIFSWIYEFTPQGLMRESQIPEGDRVTRDTGRKIDRITIVALLAVVALLVADKLWPDDPIPSERQLAGDAPGVPPAPAEPSFTFTAGNQTPAPAQSVAVLPFVNMSTAEENEHFADGLSETLLHQMAQINGLKVAARTSSFAFKGRDMDVREIGRLLGVATVLEGSVQRAGNRVRVIAQLVDTSDGAHLWSKNFDREIEDIFAIQDEIAREVCGALSVSLLETDLDRMQRTVNLEAFEALILGQQQIALRTAESLARAEQHFQRAIELDPSYALAHVGLGTVYQLQIEYADRPIADAATISEPLARKAIELDPQLADAHALLGIVLSSEQKQDEAEQSFLQAIELNPNLATAYHWYSLVLNAQFRFEEALQVIRKAEELDPLSDIIQHNVAVNLTQNGRIEEAMALLRRNIERNPDFPNFYMQMGVIHRFTLGRLDDAMGWFEEYHKRNPGSINPRSLICNTWAELKDDLKAQACIEELLEQAPDKLGPRFNQAQLAMLRGDVDAAEDILSSILEANPSIRGAQRARANLRAMTGDPDGALEDLEVTDPELFDPRSPMVDLSNFGTAVTAGYALRQKGEVERSDALFDGALEVMSGLHRTRGVGYGPLDMIIHAIRGEHDKAIAALREAIDAGWRNGWRMLEIAPPLQPIRQEPEFQSLLTELADDILEQRSHLQSEGHTAVLMR